ncbi:MAG: response regulator transcription factor [Glaciecola sp.]|jgi:DNA-binding NarL/FixJ family response regulator
MTKNVVLVDDHDLVRDGFSQLINSENMYRIVGSYADAETTLQEQNFVNVDLLICDISLPGMNGLQLIEKVKRKHPKLLVIVLSMYENPHYVLTAKALKVNSFISKRDAADVLLNAMSIVLAGGDYFSQSVSQHAHIDPQYQEYLDLTTREKEVFALLAMGHEPKKVAQILEIATKTAHVHRRNILKKFEFGNTFQLTKFALKYGLIEQSDL